MKRVLRWRMVLGWLPVAGLLGVAWPVEAAADAEALMRGSDCMVCHKADQRLVGPSFQEIAARYRGDAIAQKMLEQKVIGGGSGVWGEIPMAAHPDISTEQAEEIVKWILSQNS